MATTVESGALVTLKDIYPSSPFFREGVSLRVTGRLKEYFLETAIAVIVDGPAVLKIDTVHVTGLGLRVGSLYQFIGELHISPFNEAVLKARVGRNVDGIDMQLYGQSIQLLKQFLTIFHEAH